MTDGQKAAFVFAQSVSALAKIEGMRAENMVRTNQGRDPIYRAQEFERVPEEYGLGHNAILEMFHR